MRMLIHPCEHCKTYFISCQSIHNMDFSLSSTFRRPIRICSPSCRQRFKDWKSYGSCTKTQPAHRSFKQPPIMAEAHCALLHSALSLWPKFALPSHSQAVRADGNPWHTVLSLQAAQCVRWLYATQRSESNPQSEQMWRTSFDINLLSCNYNKKNYQAILKYYKKIHLVCLNYKKSFFVNRISLYFFLFLFTILCLLLLYFAPGK